MKSIPSRASHPAKSEHGFCEESEEAWKTVERKKNFPHKQLRGYINVIIILCNDLWMNEERMAVDKDVSYAAPVKMKQKLEIFFMWWNLWNLVSRKLFWHK